MPKVDDDTLEKVTAYFTSDYAKYTKMQVLRNHMNHSRIKRSRVNKHEHKGSSPKKITGKCGNFEKTGEGGVYKEQIVSTTCDEKARLSYEE